MHMYIFIQRISHNNVYTTHEWNWKQRTHANTHIHCDSHEEAAEEDDSKKTAGESTFYVSQKHKM